MIAIKALSMCVNFFTHAVLPQPLETGQPTLLD